MSRWYRLSRGLLAIVYLLAFFAPAPAGAFSAVELGPDDTFFDHEFILDEETLLDVTFDSNTACPLDFDTTVDPWLRLFSVAEDGTETVIVDDDDGAHDDDTNCYGSAISTTLAPGSYRLRFRTYQEEEGMVVPEGSGTVSWGGYEPAPPTTTTTSTTTSTSTTTTTVPPTTTTEQPFIGPPMNLVVEETDTGVLVDWDEPNVGNVQPEFYSVNWRFPLEGGWTLWRVVSPPITEATILHGQIEETGGFGQEYVFSVRSDNDTQELYSGWSNEVTLTVDGPPPSTTTTTTPPSTTTTTTEAPPTTTSTSTSLPPTTTSTTTTTTTTTTVPVTTTSEAPPSSTSTSTTTTVAPTTTTTVPVPPTTTASTTTLPPTTTVPPVALPPVAVVIAPPLALVPEFSTDLPEEEEEEEEEEFFDLSELSDEELEELELDELPPIELEFFDEDEFVFDDEEVFVIVDETFAEDFFLTEDLVDVIELIASSDEEFLEELQAIFEEEEPTAEEAEALIEVIEEVFETGGLDEEEVEELIDDVVEVMAAEEVTEEAIEELIENESFEELSEEAIGAIGVSLNDDEYEVRETFEEAVNVFGSEELDEYVPSGSRIPVEDRRVVIAGTAAVAIGAAPRPAPSAAAASSSGGASGPAGSSRRRR